ncbi:hypothetical protein HHI36_000897 [Cryptolaemus montrouzieri]|uniref:Uncharacterized protein n=1 Tax=Cryptolaemus montrouzieri TaxID=559131 RepID=A0ABD2P6N8_9CUCU
MVARVLLSFYPVCMDSIKKASQLSSTIDAMNQKIYEIQEDKTAERETTKDVMKMIEDKIKEMDIVNQGIEEFQEEIRADQETTNVTIKRIEYKLKEIEDNAIHTLNPPMTFAEVAALRSKVEEIETRVTQ